jgi:hypothetical protein
MTKRRTKRRCGAVPLRTEKEAASQRSFQSAQRSQKKSGSARSSFGVGSSLRPRFTRQLRHMHYPGARAA